jgi:hypothetical protein
MAVIPGEGTVFQIGTGGTAETFATVAQVLEITLPDRGADDKETTNLSSTDQEFRKLRILRGGEFSVKLQGDPSNAIQGSIQALIDGSLSSVTRNSRIVLNDAAVSRVYYQVPSLWKSWAPGPLSVGADYEITMTLRKNGAISSGTTSSY